MLYSFLVKFKVIGLNEENMKIERFKEKNIFKNLEKLDIVLSNVLTRDREYDLNKSYFIRVSCLTLESRQKVYSYIIKAQAFGEEIEFQNQKIVFEETILNDEKSNYIKKINLEDFLNLQVKDIINIRFISPTTFKFGDQYYTEPNPYLYLLKIFKKFLQVFPEGDIKKEIENMPKCIFKSIKIKDIDIKIQKLRVKDKKYTGFIGDVEFDLSSIEDKFKKNINYLFYFSYFIGVGEFTEYGMGYIEFPKFSVNYKN